MAVVASEKVMREKTLLFSPDCKKTPTAANCESLICLVFHLKNIRVANLGEDLANHMWMYQHSRFLNASGAKGNAMGCTSEAL